MFYESTLKEIRKKKGLTQDEFSKLCGIPLRTYQRIESGENYPSKYNFLKIQDVLGCSDGYLTFILANNSTDNLREAEKHIINNCDQLTIERFNENKRKRAEIAFDSMNEKGKTESVILLELLAKSPELIGLCKDQENTKNGDIEQ